MLKPMNSNDMIRPSLGRPIAQNIGSGRPVRPICCLNTCSAAMRFRQKCSHANPVRVRRNVVEGISRKPCGKRSFHN
jgi:hypothetical protein